MDTSTKTIARTAPWNKGKLLGQHSPLTLREIWAIRIRLQLDHRVRELALFNLAIDSKLRGCDLVGLRVHDIVQGQPCRRSCRCHAAEGSRIGAASIDSANLFLRDAHVKIVPTPYIPSVRFPTSS
jgi:hypothetical protein